MKKLFAALLAAIMILSIHAFAAAEEAEEFATVEALQFDKLPDIDGKISADE